MTSGREGGAQRDPCRRLRGYGRTRAQGQPTLTASFRSPAPLHYCSAAINHGEALEFRAGFYKREPGVREQRLSCFSLLIPSAAAVLSACLSAPLPRIPSERRGSPSSKHCCVSTPSAPFPQHWITQLEIMLLPVTSKPTGASAKVNTSSSQFH